MLHYSVERKNLIEKPSNKLVDLFVAGADPVFFTPLAETDNSYFVALMTSGIFSKFCFGNAEIKPRSVFPANILTVGV